MAFLGKKHVHCVAIPPPMNNLYFQRVWAIWQVLFLHWLTYKRKKHDLPISLFHVSSFHSPPPLLAWSSTFLRYQQPSPPEESQASLLAVVFWPNTRVYNHMFIDIYNVHIHIRYLVCNSPNHASAPTSISKNRGASGAPGQNPKMLATNPRIMKISKGAKIKLLRGHGRNYG